MPMWRERSETSCCTCRCKSCRRNSPFGSVVISGSPRGDLRAGSPDVQASGGLRTPWVLGPISPGGEQPGGPQRERTNEPSKLGPRVKLICGSIGDAKGFFPLPDGQRWYGRMGVHVPDSRRKLQAAILESTVAEVRKVWRPGRRTLECQRLLL